MSEETTQNIPDKRSFEERIFARFDALDARLDTFDGRLQALEVQAEKRALETKPIWERALAEILAVKERLDSLEQLTKQMMRKVDLLSRDMLTLRADQSGLEDRVEKLEPKSVQ